MNHLFNLLIVTLALVSVTGLTLAALPICRLPYGLTQSVVVLAVCLSLFFIEHYVGLGQMGWILPVAATGGGVLSWQRRALLKENAWSVIWLLIGFFYCLAWRYLYPNIDASTERMADLSFVADYAQGARLPPPDLWCPPYTLNHYYSFQHYGAGLFGRMAGIQPGMAYHLAYCLVSGLTMSAAYEAVRLLCAKRWGQSLVLAVFLVGGTGASMFTPFMIKNERSEETPWCSMRFVGTTTAFADNKLTTFGQWVKKLAPPPKGKVVEELPMETFSYVVELGDYHAPLGGSLMLAMSLAAAAVMMRGVPAESAELRQRAGAVLGATLPLTLATNAWTLPFQGIFAGGALLYYRLRWNTVPPSRSFLLGALATSVALFPFFAYFLPLTVGNQAPMRLTPAELRTPMPYFAIMFWPILVVCLIHFAVARRHAKMLSFFWLVALFVSDAVYMDDIYGPGAERFNSTLKWWPWVFNGTLLSIAAVNLNSAWRFVRIGTVVILGLVLTFTVRLGLTYYDGLNAQVPAFASMTDKIDRVFRFLTLHPAPPPMHLDPSAYHPTSFGELNGDGWLRGNALYGKDMNRAVGSLIDFLKAQPRGVMIEKPDERAFAQVGEFALFSGQPTLLGWVSHEELWRNNQTDLESRYAQINQFFSGTLPDPLRFLAAHDVRFVLWLPRNNKPETPDGFAQMQSRLASGFDWNEFYRVGNDIIGVWVRRQEAK